ncbi:MAG: HAD family phosphatase [Clostridia bacterium]|nr:HAD family phosphatase [Clostridia bacterium]MBR3810623.1 HAD family phosphatase [Clostridia bacterium]
MIKNIVFDMGGVILDFNLKKTVEAEFSPQYHDVIYEHVFGENSVWKLLDEGIYTFDQVIPGILEKLPEEIHEKITDMVTDFYDYMPPFKETYELIKELKNNGYPIYLLSNATPRFFDRYLDVPAFEFFDGFFISSCYRLLKPNREIYEAFCNKFSLEPRECFFIDDLEANIKGAKEYGMSGFVFSAPDTDSLKMALREAGVNI